MSSVSSRASEAATVTGAALTSTAVAGVGPAWGYRPRPEFRRFEWAYRGGEEIHDPTRAFPSVWVLGLMMLDAWERDFNKMAGSRGAMESPEN